MLENNHDTTSAIDKDCLLLSSYRRIRDRFQDYLTLVLFDDPVVGFFLKYRGPFLHVIVLRSDAYCFGGVIGINNR